MSDIKMEKEICLLQAKERDRLMALESRINAQLHNTKSESERAVQSLKSVGDIYTALKSNGGSHRSNRITLPYVKRPRTSNSNA